jgi:hypothetical protein
MATEGVLFKPGPRYAKDELTVGSAHNCKYTIDGGMPDGLQRAFPVYHQVTSDSYTTRVSKFIHLAQAIIISPQLSRYI